MRAGSIDRGKVPLNHIRGFDSSRDALSKIIPGLGAAGGRGVCRALEGESGFAALTSPACRSSLALLSPAEPLSAADLRPPLSSCH